MTIPIEIPDFAVHAIAIHREEEVLARHFGSLSPLIECAIQMQASRLCWRIRVGRMRWRYYEFPEEGIYMAPEVEEVPVENRRRGFQGTLTAHAFGIATSLLAFSEFAGVGGGCMERHASLLCVLAAKHAEADLISRAIAGYIG